jgi:hypothetical protein
LVNPLLTACWPGIDDHPHQRPRPSPEPPSAQHGAPKSYEELSGHRLCALCPFSPRPIRLALPGGGPAGSCRLCSHPSILSPVPSHLYSHSVHSLVSRAFSRLQTRRLLDAQSKLSLTFLCPLFSCLVYVAFGGFLCEYLCRHQPRYAVGKQRGAGGERAHGLSSFDP